MKRYLKKLLNNFGDIVSNYKSFVGRIGLIGISNILIALSSLIFIPIITKSFSTAEYGMLTQILTTVALLPNIANLGLPYTMVRFLSAETDKDKFKQSFYPMIMLTTLSTLIILSIYIIFSGPIAGGLFNGNVYILGVTVIISFFACINLMLIAYYRTIKKIKKYSLYLILQTYIGVIVSSYLTIKGYSLDVVVWGLFTGYFIVFLLMVIDIIHDLGLGFKFSTLKEELTFALPTVPSSISTWVVDSSDKYVIGIFLGSAAVGCYSPGYALGSVLLMFLSPFAVLLPAILPEYYESGDMDEVNKYMKYSLKYYLLITFPAAVGLSVLSKSLLLSITTFDIAQNGFFVTPFVALGAILMGVYGILNNILILEKKTMILGKLWIFVALLNFLLNIFCIPYIGILGAAIATLLSYAFAFVVTAFKSRKYMGLPVEYSSSFKIIFASTIMGLIVYMLNPIGIINIILVSILGAVIYFAIIFAFRTVSKKEINVIKSFI